MPCRGTGQVISNLGGAPSKLACPWCGGSGVRIPGTDAQEGWPTEQDAPPTADSSPEPQVAPVDPSA